MNKLVLAAVAAAFCSMSVPALAMDDMDMKAMDTNHDGMISKKEYMAYHEMMWGKMKKTKNGMVDLKDMGMMQGGMADDNTMKNDNMMHGGMANDKMKGK
ncbi:MAG TPA: hypothetical protein VN858_00985 [Casimicrobiaceae bacterium]|nr:hypothetical protein [Casimicrobiaceae bacterium]HXU67146.1 hypothetical protein [Casimicrobiaceae bacterium]